MKHIFICFFSLLLPFISFGQDETVQKTPNRLMHVHVITGVNFIRSEALQDSYSTKGLFFWGVGARMGNPKKQNLFVQVDYNLSRYHSIQEAGQNKGDSLLRINQLIPSLSFELVKLPNSAIRSKVGYIAAFLKDEINKVDKVSSGFRIGIGIERKIFSSQSVHLDFDYDLMKAKGGLYEDYDLWKVSLGLYL